MHATLLSSKQVAEYPEFQCHDSSILCPKKCFKLMFKVPS